MNRLCYSFAALLCLGGSAVGAPPGSAEFFTDEGLFLQRMEQENKALKGHEDFEYANADPQSKTFFPNPLKSGVPRPGFPSGLLSPNLVIQTNITQSPLAPTANPSGNPNALWVNGAGFIGSNSIKVGTDEFLNQLFSSIDLIFTSNDKTGVSVDVSTFNNFNNGHLGFIIGAFDATDQLLGSITIGGATLPEPNKSFIGVYSAVPIARLNIWGIFSIPQPFAVDNITMWTVPAPGATGVLGLAGLVAMRRRR